MNDGRLTFVVPAYRLREVGKTIAQSDEHFFRKGHSVDMIVFDDSSPIVQQKYFHTLEQTPTYNDLYYVGPREKEACRLSEPEAARSEARAADPEPLSPELRRQPQRHADVHARRPDGQRRRRHAALYARGGQPGVARPR